MSKLFARDGFKFMLGFVGMIAIGFASLILIGFYQGEIVGAKNVSTTKLKYREWYDRLLQQHFRNRGEGHIYKSQYIMVDKHPNHRKPPIMKKYEKQKAKES